MAPHPAFARVDHRPWPMPANRWTWRQTWRDLLFAHWPIAADQLRHLVPPRLEIDEFDGTSWVGVVPFRMTGVMRRPLPDLPWVSAFPELNLRLYVRCGGKPGVWFLSLDATNPLAIWAARRFFHLPYFRAKIDHIMAGESIHFHSQRLAPSVRFEAVYGPTGSAYEAKPGTLEHFLTERYCLYARSTSNGIFRCEIHHAPWPLQPAHAAIQVNELFQPFGIDLSGPPTLLHFARKVDVVVWPLEAIP